ncbi:sensor domain-containing diguanylate cyclase [Anaerotignum sp.]|uniref:sensor domain-containing diguanylate cyclase n=1 Tax=Anaerotignum sp. TaxID=2039241 RepID=UPI0028ABADC7|nr:diguanylate cyclase [Anaerotignum sp.]
MENSSLQPIIKELNNIKQNKPISQDFMNHKYADSEITQLQDIISYLSKSLEEMNVLIKCICEGNLDVDPPGRHNFLAGPLKELFSISKHIAWNTAQVAKGDYSQKIDFLGAFSENYNLMVEQLKERESRLKKNAITLEHSLNLLTSIIEVQEDSVVVVDTSTREVLYANRSAREYFYNPDTKETHCNETCLLLQALIEIQQTEKEVRFEYCCENCLRCISVKGFPIEWDDKNALVHFIKDITKRKVAEEQLSVLAYKDELTGIYNRRYCVKKLQSFIDAQKSFSVALIDLDNLKFVNDTFGHQAGDHYICTVIDTIENNIRKNDILSRVGGDEFILILPNCSEKIANSKLENIRNQLKRIRKEYWLSFSYGIKFISGSYQGSIDLLVSELDEKMYAYKKKKKPKYNL